MNKETKTTFKFSDKNVAKLKAKSRPIYYFDTYQECLVCIVQPTGTKTFTTDTKMRIKKLNIKKFSDLLTCLHKTMLMKLG